MLNGIHKVISLQEAGITEEIEETGKTLQENALLKARYVFEKTGTSCFADDTGLEIEALNGEPGVYSARYAGESKDADRNMNLVLQKLKGHANRNACFKTVIALIHEGKEIIFEGRVEGKILEMKTGTNGFGYDPIFLPEGSRKSFAEMDQSEKNKISHRGRAVENLIQYLSYLS